MADYKCISCGYITDSKKELACPECGYHMFPLPYVRRELLAKEIIAFITKLRPSSVKAEDLNFYRENEKAGRITKSKDDQHFPNLEKMRKYAATVDKTSDFIERLEEIVEQIKKHIQEVYKQNYNVDFSSVENQIRDYDEILVIACKRISIEWNPDAFVFPACTAAYSETPDDSLIPTAVKILDKVKVIIEKYKKFIRTNNIYVSTHKSIYKKCMKKEEGDSDIVVLEKCLEYAAAENDKKYILDFMEDGIKETKSMLTAIWCCINTVMESNLLVKAYHFSFDDKGSIDDKGLSEFITDLVAPRYSSIDSADLQALMSDKSEEELWNVYNDYLDMDKFGFIKRDNSTLIKKGAGEKKLQELVGLESIKNSIEKIKAYVLANKSNKDLNLHMCFYGNPGTGKTEVARIVADILYENKILPTNKVVEVDRSGLIGQYVGETPLKTMHQINRAMGGVLFVDEAYALIPKNDSGFDYGHEAVATLIKAMEDHRGEFCVILAGYRNEMHKMIASNPGFKSRIQFELDFPNYSRDELKRIADIMLSAKEYNADEKSISKILDITDIERKDPYFANARSLRNIIEQVIMCQNLRTMGENKEIGIADVNKYIEDNRIILPINETGKEQKLLSGEDELDKLIGLQTVKRMVKKIRAYAKKNSNDPDFNIHMCFIGNPGTGKTEVARIMSRILYEAGVLKEAKIIETDAHGLLGQYVGETGPKTLDKINEATEGVLFIDEAYGLLQSASVGGKTSYGDEAIAVLLKEMEDRRGHFCVILAGYKSEMKEMISSNPGLESRIQFTLEFPDYSDEELAQIAESFASKKEYSIEAEALNRIIEVADYFRKRPNFANARTVRNILDQVIMNQNLRTEDDEDNYIIDVQDVEDYITDQKINLDSPDPGKKKFGFV